MAKHLETRAMWRGHWGCQRCGGWERSEGCQESLRALLGMLKAGVARLIVAASHSAASFPDENPHPRVTTPRPFQRCNHGKTSGGRRCAFGGRVVGNVMGG